MLNNKTGALAGVCRALAYGAAVAAAIAAATFVFAFLTGGFDLRLGLDWARRVLYVIGAFCLVVGGAGLFFSGSPLRDARAGVAKDETLRSFEHAAGISWPWAIVVATVDFLVLGTLVELVLLATGA